MIGIIALISVFVAAYFAYKTANDTGRSGPLWALATLGVGLGLQIVVPTLMGVVLAVIYMALGTPVDQLQDAITGPASVIGLVALVLSFVGIWLILKHVSKLPEETASESVPPPPRFDQGE